MRSIFYLAFFAVLTMNAQNSLVQLKSASAGIGLFESNSELLKDGVTLNADISVSLKRQLFSIAVQIRIRIS